MTSSETKATDPSNSERAMLAAYEEICKSYHAIDDFRMKLLGLLPLASIVGIALIDSNKLLVQQGQHGGSELLSFAAIFAAMLTLALFAYEVRGIQRSHNLITEGEHLELGLGIKHGQFHVCVEEHAHSPLRALNAKLIACVIYSLVFAGWLFLALRFGFGIESHTCVVWASITGFVIEGFDYYLVRKLTPP